MLNQPLTFLSVCSGIEAASVAWTPLDWCCVGVAEIEKFPSAVLAHHYPDVPNYGDFTKIDPDAIGRVDILCGGTPCQAFSVAGARQSLSDSRGNLTLAFVALAHKLNPRNVVWENVPGVLSTKDNAFGCFLAGLVGASEPLFPVGPAPATGKSNRRWGWSAKERRHYVKWPRSGVVVGPKGRAAWTVKDAQYFGLAQRRERVVLVADFGNGADPFAVLFEPEGVRRDSPPSRETGEGIAAPVESGARARSHWDGDYPHPTLNQSAKGSGGIAASNQEIFSQRGAGLVPAFAIQAGALRENPNSGPDGVGVQKDIAYTLEARAEVQAVSYAPPIAPTLRAGGNVTGGDRPPGTDVDTCTSLIAVGVTGPISHALKAEGADASEDGTGRGTPIICFSAKDYGADASADLAPTLRAGGHTSSHANAGVMPAIAYCPEPIPYDFFQITAPVNRQNRQPGDPCHTLAKDNASYATIIHRTAVRRLTPRECERLQGFPDDYTNVPWRGKPDSPDGPRYKSLGNSWAVPKFQWLGRRIAAHMPLRILSPPPY